MTESQHNVAPNTCDHAYEVRILGGHPLSVRLCTLCRTPDWTDLYGQADALFRWGREEGLAGKPSRTTISAYDRPTETDDKTPGHVYLLTPGYRPEDDDPEVLRERLAAAVDERDRARRWAVSLENENRRLEDQSREAKEQARVATVAALNLQRQTPDAAQRTLSRIREARTWVAVWVELGQYFGLTAEQCGMEARARRLGDSL